MPDVSSNLPPASFLEPFVPPPMQHVPFHTHSIQFSSNPQDWHNEHAHYRSQPNPYPVSHPSPPPPTHKVWILDCRSCGTFLTNRGMRAVLLLRPNVALFSTDALPVNCSAYTSNPDVLRAPSSGSTQRTCECLTQTVCCHGCGTTVGYAIVIPCARCTTSITASNRTTNGHRFVFHSSEIISTERHYVANEPGVNAFDPTPPLSHLDGSMVYQNFRQHGHPSSHNRHPPPSPEASPGPPPLEPAQIFSSSYSPSVSPSSSTTSLPTLTPASEFYYSPYLNSGLDARRSHFDHQPYNSTRTLHSYGYHPITRTNHRTSAAVYSSSQARHPNLEFQYPADAEHKPMESPELTCPFGTPRATLKPGDVLYWHHLVRQGEITEVTEDPRARGRPSKGIRDFACR